MRARISSAVKKPQSKSKSNTLAQHPVSSAPHNDPHTTELSCLLGEENGKVYGGGDPHKLSSFRLKEVGGSVVRMVQPVTPSHTLDGTHLDMGALLRLMDIATCAAAEKHSGVNCVTVAMGDVVVESTPTLGAVLELVAEPVLVGNTSLEIALTVTGSRGPQRSVVCEAFFTYVTTRNAKGEKQLVPPLAESSSERLRWASARAAFRKALLAVESQASSAPPASPRSPGPSSDEQEQEASSAPVFECSEVVLPCHQNHMGHTFGGVVMDWMSKAALVAASRHAKCPVADITTYGVHRVSFPNGSDVSDHLVFRARVNAVFDRGAACEVGVSVVKRCINTGKECSVNVGYFTLAPQEAPAAAAAAAAVARFPPLAPTATGRGGGRLEAAAWRRRLHVARRQLLTNSGGVLEWHPAIVTEAARVTIDAARRLLGPAVEAAAWQVCEPAQSRTRSLLEDFRGGGTDVTDGSLFTLEWASGAAWGRPSFVLRASTEVAGSVDAALATVRDRRPAWDESCLSMDPIESSAAAEAEVGGGGAGGRSSSSDVSWDVVEQRLRTPTAARLLRCCLGFSCRGAEERYVLLRAWQVEGNNGGGDGSSSGGGGGANDRSAVFASRSVKHKKGHATTEILPSCWTMAPAPNSTGDLPRVAIEYAIEFELAALKRALPGLSESRIVSIIAAVVSQWFVNLPGAVASTSWRHD